jgi:hypothetical protein
MMHAAQALREQTQVLQDWGQERMLGLLCTACRDGLVRWQLAGDGWAGVTGWAYMVGFDPGMWCVGSHHSQGWLPWQATSKEISTTSHLHS